MINLKKYYLNFINKLIPILFLIFGFGVASSISIIEATKTIIMILYLPLLIIYIKTFKYNIISYLMVIYSVLFILSTVFTSNHDMNPFAYKLFINTLMFPAGVLAINFHKHHLKYIIYGLCIGSLLQLPIIVIQSVYGIGTTVTLPELVIITHNTRPSGTHNWPSQYSSVALIASFVIMMLPLSSLKKKFKLNSITMRLIAFFSSLMIFAGIVLSKTRGAMIAYIISIIVFIFLSMFFLNNKKAGIIFLIGLLIFILIFYFMAVLFFPNTIDKINSITNYHNSFEGKCRIAIYEKAYHSIVEKPLTGNGPFTFFQKSGRCNFARHCHNNYLETAYDSGITALLTIVIIEILIAFKLIKGIMRKNQDYHVKLIYISLITAYCAYFIYGLSDLVMYNATLSPLLFFGIGLISDINKITEDNSANHNEGG